MKLASIERVLEVSPIPGADRVEAARVLGYWTVVKKGEFKPGDLTVWHNPDTVVDINRPAYAFLKGKGRLRTIRLRGQVSQGLALPVKDLFTGEVPNPYMEEGSDVSEAIGIKKYEKPEPGWGGGNLRGDSRPVNWPQFLRKTDETNVQSYPALLAEFLRYDGLTMLTKKYDGCSTTIYDTPTGQGVCSRNQELEEGSSVWWDVAKKYNVLEKIKGRNIAIQGETVGPAIQGNPLKLTENGLFVFDVFDIPNQRYLSRFEVETLCHDLNLPIAEKVGVFHLRNSYTSALDDLDLTKFPAHMPAALDMLLMTADFTEYSPGVPCEGLVLRSVVESVSRHGSKGRLSAKVMSRNYVEA